MLGRIPQKGYCNMPILVQTREMNTPSFHEPIDTFTKNLTPWFAIEDVGVKNAKSPHSILKNGER